MDKKVEKFQCEERKLNIKAWIMQNIKIALISARIVGLTNGKTGHAEQYDSASQH